MNKEEYKNILNSLSNYGIFYYKFWSLANISFTDKVKTLGIYIENKKIYLIINENFWNSLDKDQKMFCVLHEILHIIFYHFPRIVKILSIDKNASKDILNIAADLIVNEKLINHFDFDSNILDFIYTYEKVFEEHSDYEYLEEIKEFHLEKLYKYLKDNQENCNLGKVALSDEHLEFDFTKEFDNFIRDNFDKEEIKKALGDLKGKEGEASPDGSSEIEKIFEIKKVIPNKKWESIVKNKLKRILFEEEDTWIMRKRSHQSLDPKFLIEGVLDIELEKKDKKLITLFLDVSGSCAHLSERFLKLVKRIPEESFIIEAYSFDTKVHKLDLKTNKIIGGGGTAFNILENELLKLHKYPEYVFVISDGFGNTVNPKHPERWNWLLTEYNTKSFIHEDSKVYLLTEFE